MKKICGTGLSCENVCPVKRPGAKCRLSLLAFAELLDAVGDVAPDGGEAGVPVLVVEEVG